MDSNKVKICIAIIAVILVIVICVVVFKKSENTNEVNSNTVENVTNTEIENEIDNDIVENTTVENTAKEQVVENEQLETKDFSNSIYESSSDAGTTNKKEEAINLVKNQWGADDTVTFTCDSITSDGIYIIAVTSKERAVVLNYFRVDLANKTVTVDY